MSAEEVRTQQATTLWQAGWGKYLSRDTFEMYLEDIPLIPATLAQPNTHFPCLVLVDRRLAELDMCDFLRISYDTETALNFRDDGRQLCPDQVPPVYWMRCHEGGSNLGKNAWQCRQVWRQSRDECGLDVSEGLCLIAQHRVLLVDQCIVLARSIPTPALRRRTEREVFRKPEEDKGQLRRPKLPGRGRIKAEERGAACLKVWNGDPILTWIWGIHAGARFGVASRLK
jgi:hypothetical protein